MTVSYRPELMWVDGSFRSGYALDVAEDGAIVAVGPASESSAEVRELAGRAMVPGLIDVHSHSFQRALRGKAESRRRSGPDFWSWRNIMYRCALALTPEEIYDVARMAFLEMALAGITAVGEFHYLHRNSEGVAYDDPNLLAKQVIGAARSVGLRIVLLHCAYVRAGFELPPDAGQVRFHSPTAEIFLRNAEALEKEIRARPATVSFGIAPHSIRAVPKAYLKEVMDWTHARGLPLHMHVAEQPAEIEACVAEYGATPFEMLDELGVLTKDFTAIHAIHLQPGEIERMAAGRITVGACPTTERNLGDGILCAGKLIDAGVSIAFGTDSHTQTDALENARELESNLRLQQLERAVLDGHGGPLPALLFDFSTRAGARSLHLDTGELRVGAPADFVTIDLDDASVAGSVPGELMTNIVFSASPRAICDVVVAGQLVIDGRAHPLHEEITGAFRRVQTRLGAEL
jgi:formimidoylglutamate deiminase